MRGLLHVQLVAILVCGVLVPWVSAGEGPALTLEPAGDGKSVAGSTVATSDTFTGGSTEIMCFTATNGSPDLEYIVSIALTFPAGWLAACSSQDAQDSDGYNVTLSCSAAANVLTYSGGSFAGGDGATWGFCASVTVPVGAPVPSSVGWVITGDGLGDSPHSVNGAEDMMPVELMSFSVE